MRSILPLVAVLAVLGLVILSCGPAGPPAFWVSPEGDDAAPGTEAEPFRTLERAIMAVEKTRGGADPDREIVVYLTDGTHRLDHPLELDPELFNPSRPTVSFRAASGARPVISGARRIRGWSVHDGPNGIYRAEIGDLVSRQLYVDGKRAIRARTELVDGHIPAGFRPNPIVDRVSDTDFTITGGIDYVVANGLNPSWWADPATWGRGDARGVEAVIETQWKMMSVPVKTVHPPADGERIGRIEVEQPAWTNANVFFSAKLEKGPDGACLPDKPGIWSLWQVTRFENAYEFIDRVGEWYLDPDERTLYYKACPGECGSAEVMDNAVVELPVLETLIRGHGTPSQPVANLHFEGITFAYATWMGPSGQNGYVSDQSGFHLTGFDNPINTTGHVPRVERTPGNLSFEYAQNVVFEHNTFEHLGAAGLDFGIGSHHNQILGNRFSDISAAAIQLGGVARNPLSDDGAPVAQPDHARHNTISDNDIHAVGRELVDAAGIFIGFSSDTDVSHNTIDDVPWAGIAIGWGWGLLDESGYPGIDCALPNQWGRYPPTPNSRNRIRFNRISNFLTNRWDGGAIYSTGQQGQSMDDPLVIEGNVAHQKRKDAGGNIFYTDGGSRYVTLLRNVSYDNPIGKMDLGPAPRPDDPLPYPDPVPHVSATLINAIPYGGQFGGCRTYGDIRYEGNYWESDWESVAVEFFMDAVSEVIDVLAYVFSHPKPEAPLMLYSKEGFFNICPFSYEGQVHPVNLEYSDNVNIIGESEVPGALVDNAGARPGESDRR